MNVDEKRAMQAVLIDEIALQQEQNPTLLIDAILSGQTHQLVHMILQRRLAFANGTSQAMTQLLRALNGGAGNGQQPAVTVEED